MQCSFGLDYKKQLPASILDSFCPFRFLPRSSWSAAWSTGAIATTESVTDLTSGGDTVSIPLDQAGCTDRRVSSTISELDSSVYTINELDLSDVDVFSMWGASDADGN